MLHRTVLGAQMQPRGMLATRSRIGTTAAASRRPVCRSTRRAAAVAAERRGLPESRAAPGRRPFAAAAAGVGVAGRWADGWRSRSAAARGAAGSGGGSGGQAAPRRAKAAPERECASGARPAVERAVRGGPWLCRAAGSKAARLPEEVEKEYEQLLTSKERPLSRQQPRSAATRTRHVQKKISAI